METLRAEIAELGRSRDNPGLEEQVLPFLTDAAPGVIAVKGSDTCRLTDADVEIIVEAVISTRTMIEVLSLPQHNISDAGVVHICRLLAAQEDYLPCMVHLDLAGNDVTYVGAEALKQVLQSNRTLRSLNLSWNPISQFGGIMIAGLVETNTTLTSLNISDAHINTTALVGILSVLHGQLALRELQLDKPQLFSRQEDTGKHVARMLQNNDTLQSLSVRKNMIGDVSAALIAQSLERNLTLARLDLSCNKIGISGAEAFASSLMRQNALVEISLAHNQIGDDGAIAFGTALQNNTGLTKLDLRFNGITDTGLCALAQGMHTNSTVTSLYIWGNEFDQVAARDFDDLVTNRLQYLGVEIDIRAYIVDGKYLVAREELITAPAHTLR